MQTIVDKKHKTVQINRTLDLPLDKVWKAWTDPQTFEKWWGPRDYTCPGASMDVKVGGQCFTSMKGKDGIEIFSIGTYLEVIPQRKLVMTDNFADSEGNIAPPPANLSGEWPDNVTISIEFEDRNGKTNFTLQHGPMPVEMYEDCIKGWNESLDKL